MSKDVEEECAGLKSGVLACIIRVVLVLLAYGFLLALQAPGLAIGVEEETGELFMSFARVSGSVFVKLSTAGAEGIFVVDLDLPASRGPPCFG